MSKDGRSDVFAGLMRSERRGTLGCAIFAVAGAVGLSSLAYWLAPSWVFWAVAIALGIIALVMIRAAVTQYRLAGMFLREASGEWQTGKPTARPTAEVQAVWADLRQRYVFLLSTALLGIERGQNDPDAVSLLSAVQETATGKHHWACVEVLNQYEAELKNLRMMVRNLLPAVPPQGLLLEMMEEWLSSMVAECDAIRDAHVMGNDDNVFWDELNAMLEHHGPPEAIDTLAAEA